MDPEGVKRVAVVGAGTMGQGIAQVFASGGFETLLFDSNPDAPAKAIEKIKSGLSGLVEKGKISEIDKETTLSNIIPTQHPDDLKSDLIIEAIVENLEVKQKLFQSLEKNNLDSTILCTNTSSLSVTQIFKLCGRPERTLGVHFFNPAPVMKLVELISGEGTEPLVVDKVAAILKGLKKVTVRAKDSPGFIVNRVARHFYLESLKILEEGGNSVEEIDSLFRAAGFKMGPFELMDLIGIDVNLAVSKAVYDGFDKNPKYKPSRIQIQKVEEGQIGRKSGKGFYDYSKK